MSINRKLALQILKYLIENPSFYFPFLVMCRGYASYTGSDEDFVEIVPIDDYENLLENPHYDEFQLWENLQDLRAETLELMSKGFIEKITSNSIEAEIAKLAAEFRSRWNPAKCNSEDITEFGENEFIGGKAEAFEESLEIIGKYLKTI